jgi:cytosine/adenosine deaminase-related metal-dependent hydrolase
MGRFSEPPGLLLIRAGEVADEGIADATGLLIRGDRMEAVGDTGRLAAEPFGPSQRIGAAEAIAIYTSGSAAIERQQHRKGRQGRLAPGYLADFVVLEADPRRTQPEGHAALRLDA